MSLQRVASARVVLEVVVVVALAEALIMFVLGWFAPDLPRVQEAALDAVILSMIVGPYLLWRIRTQQIDVERYRGN